MRSLITRHRDALSGLISLGGSRLLLTGMSLLSSILIARGLGAEQLGMFALITAAFAYVSIFSEFGLRSTITAEASRRNDTGAVFAPYIRLRLLIATLAYTATLAVTGLFYPAYFKPTALIMLSIFFFALQIDWILLANRQYQTAGWISMTRWMAYLALIAMAMQFWHIDINVIAYIFLCSWMVGALSSWLAVIRNGGSLKPRPGTIAPDEKQLLKSGAPVLGATLISQALQNSDLLWAGKTFGASDAGHYYLASSVIGAGLIFANAIGQMATVQYAPLRNDPEKIIAKLKSDIWLMLSISLIVSIVIYAASPLARLLFGDEYFDVVTLIRRFIPYLILYHIWSLYFFIFIAIGLEKPLLKVNLATASLIPPLLILTTTLAGLNELAIAKGGILFGGILFMQWQLSTTFHLKFGALTKPLASALIVAFGIASIFFCQP